jgi:hypothetical protein
MAINRPKEERHRWTPKEEAFLIEASEDYPNILAAAEALYQKVNQPERCVVAKLRSMQKEGLLPHFGLPNEQEIKTRACYYIRKLKEVMKANGYNTIMVEAEAAASAVQGNRTIVLSGT